MNERQQHLQTKYDEFVKERFKLDLTRGKPSAEQLDLSNELDGILDGFYLLQDGTDVRNYGGILGIPEARQLGAELLDVNAEQVMVGGNSSLTLMYHFLMHKRTSWGDDGIKFLCPVPGYDRHFTICEHLDIEMISIPMLAGGPDMDLIEQMVKEDEALRGIWCVPKHSNPTGHTYSDETVQRFAGLASSDFQIFWDNAYAMHDLRENGHQLKDILTEAKKHGGGAGISMFASTSKITFAGAGISFLATTPEELSAFAKYLSAQMIGFDKVNQLRHVRFLKDKKGIADQMAKHRAIIEPKFDLVLAKLKDNLGGKGIADWTNPKGGYFVSLDTRPGLATEIVAMADAAGVKLTPAGATFPYRKDPENRNIRIAPTYPPLDELNKAMNVFVTCVELATLNAEPGQAE